VGGINGEQNLKKSKIGNFGHFMGAKLAGWLINILKINELQKNSAE